MDYENLFKAVVLSNQENNNGFKLSTQSMENIYRQMIDKISTKKEFIFKQPAIPDGKVGKEHIVGLVLWATYEPIDGTITAIIKTLNGSESYIDKTFGTVGLAGEGVNPDTKDITNATYTGMKIQESTGDIRATNFSSVEKDEITIEGIDYDPLTLNVEEILNGFNVDDPDGIQTTSPKSPGTMERASAPMSNNVPPTMFFYYISPKDMPAGGKIDSGGGTVSDMEFSTGREPIDMSGDVEQQIFNFLENRQNSKTNSKIIPMPHIKQQVKYITRVQIGGAKSINYHLEYFELQQNKI